MRGVAAVAVVLYHVALHYKQNVGVLPATRLTNIGHTGVDFFFVLSGFIIMFAHRQDIGHPDRVFSYLAKRIARVFPFYWVMLAATLVVAPLVESQRFPTLLRLLEETFLWPGSTGPMSLGVAWSLRHETLFYIIFAVGVLNRRLFQLSISIWFFMCLVHWVRPLEAPPGILLSAYNLQFAFGMLAAVAYNSNRLHAPQWTAGAGALLYCLAAGCELAGYLSGFGFPARIAYGVASGLVVLGLAAGERRRLAPNNAWLSFLGRCSYAIYLCHLFVAGILYKAAVVTGIIERVPNFISYTILCGLTIGVACLVSTLVELPLSKAWRDYLLSRNLPVPLRFSREI